MKEHGKEEARVATVVTTWNSQVRTLTRAGPEGHGAPQVTSRILHYIHVSAAAALTDVLSMYL